METTETIIIKKSVYGESDYLVTLFTRNYGKVKALARNAKNSKKRFGGRLEQFVLLNADISINENKFNILNDISILNSFPKITENLESFAFATFFLEHLELLTIEEQQNEDLFNVSVDTLWSLNEGLDLLPNILKFQLKLLEINGIKPEFDAFEESEIIFDITDGALYTRSEKQVNSRYRLFSNDIVKKPELMGIFLKKVARNTKVLTKYIENYTDRIFKTSSFLDEISL